MLCMKQKKIAADLAHWIESQKPTGRTLISAIELTFENHFEPKEKMESSSSLLERARKLEREAVSFAQELRNRSVQQHILNRSEPIHIKPDFEPKFLNDLNHGLQSDLDNTQPLSPLGVTKLTFEEVKRLEWNEVQESIENARATGGVDNRLRMLIDFGKHLEQQITENSHDA